VCFIWVLKKVHQTCSFNAMLVLGWFSVDFISLYFAIINGLTTRTYKGDLRIRNPLLCPPELRAKKLPSQIIVRIFSSSRAKALPLAKYSRNCLNGNFPAYTTRLLLQASHGRVLTQQRRTNETIRPYLPSWLYIPVHCGNFKHSV